jgi:tetratricopeptide (TPR) repeat protein
MSALPRPDLPPGPQRDLNDALHELHHRAGWPSLRTLAKAAGCSHTTVSTVFSSSRLPAWGLVELLVEAMDGDTAAFRELWVAACSPAGDRAGAAPRIAGRTRELAVVRQHLESGTGLLLVAGEAGIGKTRLVTTAADSAGDDILVIHADCLPLATEVPLLPWAAVLQQVATFDGGRWLDEALAGTPAYVPEVLGRLVPDLAAAATSRPADDRWRQHLFLATATVVSALRSSRSWAILLEDLHWADLDTLDLLAHLLSRGTAIPLLGTWRLDDPSVRPPVQEWWARASRTAEVVELGPLTRDETAGQLELLTGSSPSASDVERIHARTLGLPLFTEQLAAAGGAGEQVPRMLDDLLAQRLGGLSSDAWAVAAVLGSADRDLDLDVVHEASELRAGALSAGLHELTDRYLLRDGASRRPGLRHPLVAEAVRRRLLGPESAAVHRRLAEALGRANEPAAEVAEHWQRAGDRSKELRSRVAAAMEAGDQFAVRMEWIQWLRVLDLWTEEAGGDGSVLGISLPEALLRAHDAAFVCRDLDRAGELLERLLVITERDGVSGALRATALARSGDYHGNVGDVNQGITLLDEAVGIFQELDVSTEQVEAMENLAYLLATVGDDGAALPVIRRAVELAKGLGHRQRWRHAVANLAWFESRVGNHDVARALTAEALDVEDPDADPFPEIGIAVTLTDMLIGQHASIDQMERAAQVGLEIAARWELDTYGTRMFAGNLAQGYLAAGRLNDAASALGEVPERVRSDDAWRQLVRARISTAHGSFDEAARLVEPPANPVDSAPADLVQALAELEVWRGEPGPAVTRLKAFLAGELDGMAAPWVAEHLLLLARSRADQAELESHSVGARKQAAAELRELARRLPVDPFGAQISPVPRHAWQRMWQAELARLEGTETTQEWAAVAAAWDPADRPHHAAYCRWRAARVALAGGQGTNAARLLRRAARDAREHGPLSAAIAATAHGD